MSLPAPASMRRSSPPSRPSPAAGLRPALTAAAVRRLISAAGTAPEERLTRPQDQQSGKTKSLPNPGQCKPPNPDHKRTRHTRPGSGPAATNTTENPFCTPPADRPQGSFQYRSAPRAVITGAWRLDRPVITQRDWPDLYFSAWSENKTLAGRVGWSWIGPAIRSWFLGR